MSGVLTEIRLPGTVEVIADEVVAGAIVEAAGSLRAGLAPGTGALASTRRRA